MQKPVTKKNYFKSNSHDEMAIQQLSDQLTVIDEPDKISQIINLIRKIQTKTAYQAGQQSGYRNGFQAASSLLN